MTRFTVFGGDGFVGSHLVRYLRACGHEVEVPQRNADVQVRDLGVVIYSIGVTADFRRRQFDAIEAHVQRFREVVTSARYESLVYLSSTRLYRYGRATQEDAPIVVRPREADDLYAISKCMGESIALTVAPRCKVVRLSNVYGDDFASDNFLSSIIRDALRQKHVELQTAFSSAKDYISVDEVCELLLRISLDGREQIYNVASGISTSHGEICKAIARVTAATFEAVANAPEIRDQPIDTSRISREFAFTAVPLVDQIEEIVVAFRKASVAI